MLKFHANPPERAGDVELGAAGTRYDMELIQNRSHALFLAGPTEGFTLLGMMASHSVSESRIESEAIAATPEDTLEIIKPVVDEVGRIFDRNKAICFARGVFHAVGVDFPDFRNTDDWDQRLLFQGLISGVNEEAAQAIQRRTASSAAAPINS